MGMAIIQITIYCRLCVYNNIIFYYYYHKGYKLLLVL